MPCRCFEYFAPSIHHHHHQRHHHHHLIFIGFLFCFASPSPFITMHNLRDFRLLYTHKRTHSHIRAHTHTHVCGTLLCKWKDEGVGTWQWHPGILLATETTRPAAKDLGFDFINFTGLNRYTPLHMKPHTNTHTHTHTPRFLAGRRRSA